MKLTRSLTQIYSFTCDFCTHILPTTATGQWVCCGDDRDQLCAAWDSPIFSEKKKKNKQPKQVVKLSLPDNAGLET